MQGIFSHHQSLRGLNLAFIDSLTDDFFSSLSLPSSPPSPRKSLALTPDLTIANPQTLLRATPAPDISSSPLECLNISKSRITDGGLLRLASLKNLTEIRLQWCTGVTDEGINALTKHCDRLTLLDLRSCDITDRTLESVAYNCKYLVTLDLSWCVRVTDTGLSHLSPEAGSHCLNLESLKVTWCTLLTDESLAVFMLMRSLKSVAVAGCPAVTEDGIKRLRAVGVSISQ